MSKKVVCAALGAVIALGIGTQAMAKHSPSNNTHKTLASDDIEKCYGVAKAGKNDCGSTTLSCAGQAKSDNSKTAWIAVPKGTCNKIVGGSTSESGTS